MTNIRLGAETRWGLNFLALLGVVAALWLGQMLILPVVVSLMLTAVLWPVIKYLHVNLRLPRGIASLLGVTGLVALCILAILWAVYALQEVVGEFSSKDKFQSHYQRARQHLRALDWTSPMVLQDPHALFSVTTLGGVAGQPFAWREVEIAAALDVEPAIMRSLEIVPRLTDRLLPEDPYKSFIYLSVLPYLQSQIEHVPHLGMVFLGQALLVLFLVLFMSMEGDMLMRRTVAIFGPTTGPDSLAALNALMDMARAVRSYLIWRTLINIIMAVFLGVIYDQLGLRNPWLWAILAGILTYVPYLGPIVAVIPALGDAFLEQGVTGMFIVGFIFTVIITIEGYVVFPLVLGRNMEMNATTVMLACTFWWLVWGEIGLFLALPLMAGIKAICQHVPGWEPWANLMAREDADDTPAEPKPADPNPPEPPKVEAREVKPVA